MSSRRIITGHDLRAVVGLLSEIRTLGDKVAAIMRRVPLDRSTDTPLVIGQKEEALIMHFLVAVRQIAELAACIKGVLDEPEGEDRYRGWSSFLCTGISDILCQARKLCQVLGFDFMDTVRLGEERNQEKVAEFYQKHPDLPWY